MTDWVLIIFIYAGVFSGGDSVTVTTTDFSSEKACNAAQDSLSDIGRDTKKRIRTRCVKKSD